MADGYMDLARSVLWTVSIIIILVSFNRFMVNEAEDGNIIIVSNNHKPCLK